jgi:hypothetical protein
MSARLEPACGSESAMVPKNRPSTIGATYRSTCSGVPCSVSRLAAAMVSSA